MSRRIRRFVLLGVIPTVVLATIAYIYAIGGRYVETENAYVKAKLVAISTDIDGRVIEVRARNNQRVEIGDVLFKIDPAAAKISLAGAEAEILNVQLRINSLRARHHQHQLEIGSAESRVRYLARESERLVKLKDKGLGTESLRDQAAHALEMAKQSLQVAQQRSSQTLAELGGDPDTPNKYHALFLAAKSKRDTARRELDHTVIQAPAAGILSNVSLEAGEFVEAGKPVFSIVGTDEIWVEANLKESQLTHVREKQSAIIVIDAFPDQEFRATVHTLSPATGAEFAVLPPQNATGNWVKVVQRIPVRLHFTDTSDSAVPTELLRAGMTAAVSIDTHFKRQLPTFLRSVFAGVMQEQ